MSLWVGPLPHRHRPPLRFDRSFLAEPDNQLKIVQMACGLFALLLTLQCWPNQYRGYCVAQLMDFFQLFNAVCVHSFFLAGTFILSLAHLFSAPDAFYHYNFPLLEKFYCALATAMYVLGSTFALINLFRAVFSLLWFFHVAATFAGFVVYLMDFWRRWRRDRESSKAGLQTSTSPYIT